MSALSPTAHQIHDLTLLLDPAALDCRMKIADLRERMDAACAQQEISLHEWRALVDAVARVRSLCEGARDGYGMTGPAHQQAGKR